MRLLKGFVVQEHSFRTCSLLVQGCSAKASAVVRSRLRRCMRPAARSLVLPAGDSTGDGKLRKLGLGAEPGQRAVQRRGSF